jgi:hypothetical protein
VSLTPSKGLSSGVWLCCAIGLKAHIFYYQLVPIPAPPGENSCLSGIHDHLQMTSNEQELLVGFQPWWMRASLQWFGAADLLFQAFNIYVHQLPTPLLFGCVFAVLWAKKIRLKCNFGLYRYPTFQ